MKIRFFIFALAVLLMITVGCQATPETSAVTSKIDGTFEAALENAAEETETAADGVEETAETEETVEAERYTTTFTSTDGSFNLVQWDRTSASEIQLCRKILIIGA